MISVHVQLYSILREKLPAEAQGRTTLRFEDGATLDDVLQRLAIGRRVVISVNGRHEPDGVRPLQDEDEVKIFSSVGGGARSPNGRGEGRRAPGMASAGDRERRGRRPEEAGG
ncbi:MAG: MoaD/ThiS family protein [Candidatus Promineifilaceae bacterium]